MRNPYGKMVTVHFLDQSDPPYFLVGTCVANDEEHITLRGEVGDYIGQVLVVPHNRIKFMRVSKAKDEDW